MRGTCSALFVAAALCLFSRSYAQDADNLRWQFKPGQSHKYLFKHKEVRKVEVGDLKAETTTIAEFDWLWTVQDVDASGAATLDVKVNNLRFATTGQNFDYHYDSSRGNLGDSDYHKRLIGLLDQLRYAGKYQLRIDPAGRVLEVKGMSKVLEENNPGLQILDYHGMNLHDETFAWFLQQALGRLPGKGDKHKWQVAVEASLGDMGTATGQLEFERAAKPDEQGLITIRWQGSQSADLNTKWVGVDVKGTLKTTKLVGKMVFDPRAGRLHSGIAIIGMAGDLKVGGGGFKMTYQHELELTKQP